MDIEKIRKAASKVKELDEVATVQSMYMHNGKLVITNNKGTFLIEPPVDKFRSVSQVNNHLYCDGYEYDFENQKRIAKSWWKKIFG